MANNDVNNQIKINGLFRVCKSVTVIFGVILLSTWTVKSASLVNSNKQVLQQDVFKEITGIVKTQEGEPISGVVVLKVGTNQGTETDIEGKYSLDANAGDKIQFTYEGFHKTTATVNQSNILNITMVEDDSGMLSSVDITNYYPLAVSRENICTFPNRNNMTQILSGHVPNLNIATESRAKTVTTTSRIECAYPPRHSFIHLLQGQLISIDFSKLYNPSERNPEVILKEVEALTRNGNYTYIVDGVRVSEETFRSLNQNNVESVDIYKHTDVYNARFGNKENQSRILWKLNKPPFILPVVASSSVT